MSTETKGLSSHNQHCDSCANMGRTCDGFKTAGCTFTPDCSPVNPLATMDEWQTPRGARLIQFGGMIL